MSVHRVLRGVIRTAVTWAVVWVPLSIVPFGIKALFGGFTNYLTPQIVGAMVISQALAGAINGAAFATILAVRGRRRTFNSLSLPWIASCGAIGAVTFPLAVRAVLEWSLNIQMPLISFAWTVVNNAALGAGLASISLSVARRARELDGGDGDMPSVGAGEVEREPEEAQRALPNVQPILIH